MIRVCHGTSRRGRKLAEVQNEVPYQRKHAEMLDSLHEELQTALPRPVLAFKGTVSPDYKCFEVISIKSPWFGHVTPDI
jgi:hypothetical protein